MTKPIASIRKTCFIEGVYEPSDDSFLLVDALFERLSDESKALKPALCVEIGSGSGYAICSLALMLRSLGVPSQLLAIDINPMATLATSKTLASHGTLNVDVVQADLVGGLSQIAGKVDLLIFNPPYVSTPDEEVHRGGLAASWAGGERGRRVTDKLLPLVADLLSEKGEFFLIALDYNDPGEILEVMLAHGLHGSIVRERTADEERLIVLRFWRQKLPTCLASHA